MSKILIVDDNKMDQVIVGKILLNSGENYDIRKVGSGQAALKEMKKDPADLVILDIVMPDIDGVDTYNSLMTSSKNSYLPIIFISAYLQPSVKLMGLRLGAWDYMAKPLNPEELLAKVSGALKIKESIDTSQKNVEKAHEKIYFLNSDLEQKNEELKKFNVLKDKFIATVSHELSKIFPTIT